MNFHLWRARALGRLGTLAAVCALSLPAHAFAGHFDATGTSTSEGEVRQRPQPPDPQRRPPARLEPALLSQLIAEAMQNNPEILAAAKEREAAQQRILPAGSLDDPMLEAGVINLPVESLSFNREDMTMKMIGIAQRFPYPGKRGLRQDVAAKDAESAGYGYRETVNRVVREVKVAYFDLAFIIESARLTEKNRLGLEQFLRIAESRYAVGQGAQADVLRAQTQLSKMLDELIRLGRERRMAEADLNRALGRSTHHSVPQPEIPPLKEVPLRLDSLDQAALKERPQLLALQSILARADKAIELARKDYYPDFDVRFSYGQRDRMLDGARREDMISFTVAINLPVWRENKLAPRVAEAVAMRDQALSMSRAQQNEVSAKLHHQVVSAEQTFRSARLYETGILPQARLTVEAALAAYRVNRVDFMTLLDSQMTVFNLETGYASALAGYHKALAEIEFLTGTPVR